MKTGADYVDQLTRRALRRVPGSKYRAPARLTPLLTYACGTVQAVHESPVGLLVHEPRRGFRILSKGFSPSEAKEALIISGIPRMTQDNLRHPLLIKEG